MKIVVPVSLDRPLDELLQPVQSPAVNLGHLVQRDVLWLIIAEIAEHEPACIADSPISFRDLPNVLDTLTSFR